MTAAVFLCMSKLLRSKTLHVIPGLTRNLIDEKNRLDDLIVGVFYIGVTYQKCEYFCKHSINKMVGRIISCKSDVDNI
jgi:hypothetical protein